MIFIDGKKGILCSSELIKRHFLEGGISIRPSWSKICSRAVWQQLLQDKFVAFFATFVTTWLPFPHSVVRGC